MGSAREAENKISLQGMQNHGSYDRLLSNNALQ